MQEYEVRSCTCYGVSFLRSLNSEEQRYIYLFIDLSYLDVVANIISRNNRIEPDTIIMTRSSFRVFSTVYRRYTI